MTNPTTMPDLAIWLRERVGRTLYYRHWVLPQCRDFVAVPVRIRVDDIAWWILLCGDKRMILGESRKCLRSDVVSKVEPIPGPSK